MKTAQEIFAEDIQRFRHEIKGLIEDMFKELKEIQPIVFALERSEGTTRFGILNGIGQLFTSEQGKEIAAGVLRDFSKEHKVIAIATAFEGWMRQVSVDKKDEILDENGNYRKDIKRPSEAEDRIEVLMLGFETHDKHSKIFYTIDRSGPEPTLKLMEDIQWTSKDGMMKGRFDDILTENYTAMAESLRETLQNNAN